MGVYELDYYKLIVPKKLYNSQPSGEWYEDTTIFNTEDYLFLPGFENQEIMLSQFGRRINQVCNSDYYTLCNGQVCKNVKGTDRGELSVTRAFSREFSNDNKIYCMNELACIEDSAENIESFNNSILSVSPVVNIDVEELLKEMAINPYLLKINDRKYPLFDKWISGYHTIEMGEFPQTYVGDELNSELENAFLYMRGIKETSRKFCGFYDEEADVFDKNEEYEYKGEKYVRVKAHKYDNKSCFKRRQDDQNDALEIQDGKYYWCKVEPINWKILNWKELPTEINPEGSAEHSAGETSKTMCLWCEDALLAMPFNRNMNSEYSILWKNSTPRGYFNGISVNNIFVNDDAKFGVDGGGDFTNGNNFLTQAFGIDPRVLRNEITIGEKNMVNTKKIKGSYGVIVVDSKEKPMPVAEQIEFYINNSIPFMLHGPSGVGKSRRIKDICPDFSSIKLARGMVPENAQGRDVFGFVNGKAESDWAPPAWYKDMCEKAEAKAPEKHILFIDEVTNVDLEQSYLYDIVLERQIAPGIGKFPDNVSVVLAGNEIKDSSVASALAEPLFRRQAHIYLEPNIPDWLEWGSRLKEDGTTNVHPLISDFVASHGTRVFYTPYDNDNPPKHVLDPRGWEQASDIIYANNGELRLELLANKVGSNIAQNILAFAKQPVITVEDIVAGEIDTSAIPKAYDAKYSMAMRLRNANEEELAPVREFVKKYLGDEMLSVYDATWVGKDKDRAIFLNELKKQQSQEDVEEEVVEEPQVRYNLYDKKALNEGLSGLGRFVDVVDFWRNDKKKAIKCDAQWQADVLMYVFNKMGKTWRDGNPYEVGSSNWGRYLGNKGYGNDGTFGSWPVSDYSYKIYNFDDIDYSSVASVDEIVDALGKGEEFKIDVDKFWETEADLNIHCPEEWQAEILMNVFNRMGKRWRNKSPYAAEDSSWIINGVKSCYSNDGSFGQQEKIRGRIYPFEDVDLSKYLSDEEIKEIQDKMPGTAYDNIIVM